MANEPLLDQYLEDLDRALGPVSMSDRVELLSRIKDRAQRGGGNMTETLREIGDPYQVAQDFLQERGLRAVRKSSGAARSFFKVLLTTFAILFLMTVAGAGYLVWRFSPLVQVDEGTGRVKLLGGYIDLDGKEGQIRIGGSLINTDEFDRSYTVSRSWDPGTQALEAIFTNGSLAVSQSVDRRLHIQCRMKGGQAPTPFSAHLGKAILNLGDTEGSKCEVQLPAGVGANVRGHNGKIILENLDAPVQAELAQGRIVLARPGAAVSARVENGMIQLEPDPSRSYRYEAKVELGTQDPLESSTDPQAIPIQLAVKRGSLSVEDALDLGE
jgi:hypothetical protein